jgi:hypothetical protein
MPLIGTLSSGGLAPGAPTIGTASDGGTGTTASVAFTAPSWVGKGSGTVTYTATSSPGNLTGTGTSSPITVSGLTTGTAYTFTVRATTSYGVTGPSSAASNSVTPAAPGSYEDIATVTITSSGTSSITFSSIPQTYKHLELRGYTRGASGGITTTNTYTTFNSDNNSGRYNMNEMFGDGGNNTSITPFSSSTIYLRTLYMPGGAYNANIYGVMRMFIFDYTNSNLNRSLIIQSGYNTNGDAAPPNQNQYINHTSGGYIQSTAISNIAFTNDGGGWEVGSTFSLYGIKGS